MRGIPPKYDVMPYPTRITPAHAGNTKLSGKIVAVHGDHPRACGEYLHTVFLILPVLGSPPRMRGIRQEIPLLLDVPRITPAHAGNTESAPLLLSPE